MHDTTSIKLATSFLIQWPSPSHVYFLSLGLQAGVLFKEFVLFIKSSLITYKKEAIELNI